ncbi:CHASE domain-containing protein [Hoeflea sp. G2-23]|uniref:histidine kinase n=1 Tax=Hoeflea algicola TaxID=2983763 RepID=A0ABT3Z7B1_9HYPH|nr:CHASE domain-containing protein [Hoeflea algicola]MCY0147667.1 CHASE domain-containing protein [Hoeflea algicola]
MQPALVFIVVALVGMLTAAASWYTIDQANRMSFASIAEEAVRRLSDRIENHMLLIKSTEALFEATGEIPDAAEFKIFIGNLRKTEQFDGVQGIGFARYVQTGPQTDAAIGAELARNYSIQRTPWPETEEQYRTPIVLLEPSTDANLRALGYDMYSNSVRRTAILAALSEQRLRASGSVRLVQENQTDPQAGFLIYTPYFAANSSTPQGFIYAPFSISNLFKSALNRLPALPIHVTAWDGEPADTNQIFQSTGERSNHFGASHVETLAIEVAGRLWKLEIRPSEIYEPPVDQTRSFMLAAAALLLAGALAASSRSQQRTIEVGEALRQETERALTDREFLLQEMKHRIKNMIARMLAMSRQTARASETLDEFTQSFTARLQAMAASQDLLARTAWQSADLKTLLALELRQLFGDKLKEEKLVGPTVELNEVAAQAFGLAFHELATNALKYGSARSDTGMLDISWHINPEPETGKELVFTWREHSEVPLDQQDSDALSRKGGFGTKLLDATMRVELGGSITTIPNQHGIDVTIRVPHARVMSNHQNG